MLSPKAWFRLLTFRSDLRIISKIFLPNTAKQKKKQQVTQNSTSETGDISQDVDLGNFNNLFPPAFFKIVNTQRKILLLFSGADRLAWEFEEKFVPRYGEKLEKHYENYKIHTIKNANHILSDKRPLVE